MPRTKPGFRYRSRGMTTGILSLLVLTPGASQAGWGDQDWGTRIWGGVAVPGPGPVGLAVLAALLLGTGVWVARVRQARSALVLALLVAVPLAARAATLPYSFANGTVADADEVNANFDALAYRTIPRATGLGPGDNTDSGAIVSRTFTLDKDRPDTAFQISYTDNFGVLAINKACRWEIRVDGSTCPTGALVYDYVADTAYYNKSHTLVGYCGGLADGSHTISVHVGNVPGYSGSNCYTGFSDSRWVLEAEEIL